MSKIDEQTKQELFEEFSRAMNAKYFLIPRKITQLSPQSINDFMGITMNFVCDLTGFTHAEISSGSRKQDVIFARQIYFYLLRRYFGEKISFLVIGKSVNRDHATVMFAVKQLNNHMDTEKRFRERVHNIYDAYHDFMEALNLPTLKIA